VIKTSSAFSSGTQNLRVLRNPQNAALYDSVKIVSSVSILQPHRKHQKLPRKDGNARECTKERHANRSDKQKYNYSG